MTINERIEKQSSTVNGLKMYEITNVAILKPLRSGDDLKPLSV